MNPEHPSPRSMDQLRDAARQAAAELELDLVVLFGSTLRADRKPQDLDLALKGARRLDLLQATNRFAVLLGRNDVDLVDLSRAEPLLLMRVATEGMPLFDRTGAELNVLRSLAARRFADTRKFRDAERDYLRSYTTGRRTPG
jgi:predicted nucleotidyltransferase